MKKTEPKQKGRKKENAIETLARLVANGFSKMENKFVEMENKFVEMENRFGGMEKRLDKIDEHLDRIKERLGGVEREQTETNRRLDSLERKQSGLLLSVDESVHRAEFEKLMRRVDVLEKNKK